MFLRNLILKFGNHARIFNYSTLQADFDFKGLCAATFTPMKQNG